MRRYNKSKKNARKKRLLAVVAVQQPIKNGLHAIVVACGAKMSAYFCVCTQVILILHFIDSGAACRGFCLNPLPGMKNTEKEPINMDKKKTNPKNGKVTIKKRITVVLLNLLAMAAVLAVLPVLALRWVDSYTNHGEACAVPDVCGVQLDDAVSLLAKEKLDYAVIERRYKENALEDEVIMQYPEPGSAVKEGRKVGLVLNSAVKPKRSIPSVIDNRTYREAESHIKAAGFVIERVDTIPGEKDWVYELRYNGKLLSNGEAIPQGAAVTVAIGSGKESGEEGDPVFDSNFDI